MSTLTCAHLSYRAPHTSHIHHTSTITHPPSHIHHHTSTITHPPSHIHHHIHHHISTITYPPSHIHHHIHHHISTITYPPSHIHYHISTHYICHIDHHTHHHLHSCSYRHHHTSSLISHTGHQLIYIIHTHTHTHTGTHTLTRIITPPTPPPPHPPPINHLLFVPYTKRVFSFTEEDAARMAARLRRESWSNNSLGGKSAEAPVEGTGGTEGTSEEPSASGESGGVKRRPKKDRERRFSAPPGGKRQHGDRDSIGSYLSESQGVLLKELAHAIKVYLFRMVSVKKGPNACFFKISIFFYILEV